MDFELPDEQLEPAQEKQVCKNCGNDTFRVYIRIIIDDARMYCAECGEFHYQNHQMGRPQFRFIQMKNGYLKESEISKQLNFNGYRTRNGCPVQSADCEKIDGIRRRYYDLKDSA